MHQTARLPYTDGLHTDSPRPEATRDRRDPVVALAIKNVTSKQQMEEWWAMAPGVRTHAIYDEVRRLDRASAGGSTAPVEEIAGKPRPRHANDAASAQAEKVN